MGAADTREPPVAAEEALAALRGLPPLSAVAIQLQLLGEEDLSIDDAAEMIKADAALSADVLRLANSPLLGMRHPPTGILHAAALLGLNRVMTLVITAALRSFGSRAHGTAALNRCWRHNLACALICEELADKVGVERDVAYMAGLLHDIGRCGMLAVWTARYSRLLDSAGPDPLALLTLERQEFGISHVDAGAVLLRDWNLPSILVEAVRLHHDPPKPGVTDYLGMVQCSCALADHLGFVVTGVAAAEDQTLNVPPPWRDILAGLPEEFAFSIAERINSLQSHLLP